MDFALTFQLNRVNIGADFEQQWISSLQNRDILEGIPFKKLQKSSQRLILLVFLLRTQRTADVLQVWLQDYAKVKLLFEDYELF